MQCLSASSQQALSTTTVMWMTWTEWQSDSRQAALFDSWGNKTRLSPFAPCCQSTIDLSLTGLVDLKKMAETIAEVLMKGIYYQKEAWWSVDQWNYLPPCGHVRLTSWSGSLVDHLPTVSASRLSGAAVQCGTITLYEAVIINCL